ncbi:MAG: DMT family transporter [Betaproteobacteria bacterium]
MSPAPLAGYAFAGGALVLFASNAMITRVAVRRLALSTGFLVVVVVNVVVGALVLALELALRAQPLTWDAFGVAVFLVAGFFSTFLGRWFFFAAVERLGPARASTWQVTSPLWTAAFAFALGERLSWPVVAAMAVTCAGLTLVATSPGTGGRARSASRAFAASGAALGIGSAIGYAMGNILRSVAVARWDEAIAGALLGAIAGLAVQVLVGGNPREIPDAIRRADRQGLALYGVMGVVTMLAQILTVLALARLPAAIVALIVLATPLITFPASYLWLRHEENINARTAAGVLLALAGLAAIVLR